uniref:Uncharacterized protein n=1 Tax=Knipowitschia caucasica TaxID=637954 RepID=A0AAV2L9R6_KNICA
MDQEVSWPACVRRSQLVEDLRADKERLEREVAELRGARAEEEARPSTRQIDSSDKEQDVGEMGSPGRLVIEEEEEEEVEETICIPVTLLLDEEMEVQEEEEEVQEEEEEVQEEEEEVREEEWKWHHKRGSLSSGAVACRRLKGLWRQERAEDVHQGPLAPAGPADTDLFAGLLWLHGHFLEFSTSAQFPQCSFCCWRCGLAGGMETGSATPPPPFLPRSPSPLMSPSYVPIAMVFWAQTDPLELDKTDIVDGAASLAAEVIVRHLEPPVLWRGRSEVPRAWPLWLPVATGGSHCSTCVPGSRPQKRKFGSFKWWGCSRAIYRALYRLSATHDIP